MMETLNERSSAASQIGIDSLWIDVTKPKVAPQENERLSVVKKVRYVMDSAVAKDKVQNALATLKAEVKVSIVLLALIDEEELSIQKLSDEGVWDSDEGTNTLKENPWITTSVSADSSSVLLINDCVNDVVHMNNELASGKPHVRFCAGCPVVFDGQNVGALFMMDQTAREGFATGDETKLLDTSGKIADIVREHATAVSAGLGKSMMSALNGVGESISSVMRRLSYSQKITPETLKADLPPASTQPITEANSKRNSKEDSHLYIGDKTFLSSLTGAETTPKFERVLSARDMNFPDIEEEVPQVRELQRKNSMKISKPVEAVLTRKASSKKMITRTSFSSEHSPIASRKPSCRIISENDPDIDELPVTQRPTFSGVVRAKSTDGTEDTTRDTTPRFDWSKASRMSARDMRYADVAGDIQPGTEKGTVKSPKVLSRKSSLRQFSSTLSRSASMYLDGGEEDDDKMTPSKRLVIGNRALSRRLSHSSSQQIGQEMPNPDDFCTSSFTDLNVSAPTECGSTPRISEHPLELLEGGCQSAVEASQ
jgi:glycerol-3-phosphate cytidylyltransferase-like family protein